MNFRLRPSLPADLKTVLPWVTSPAALTRWCGPMPTWPPNPQKTWREILAADGNTFTLVDSAGEIAAFGQAFFREPDSVHLGRIIVSPSRRGEGIGRVLCEQLIRQAVERWHPAAVTLNVYRDNLPALALYRSLGFEVTSENEEHNSYGMYKKIEPD